MKFIDLTLGTPEENLACDEALLDACEEDPAVGVLRFWEPAEYFVVVGYANPVQSEVAAAICQSAAVPILRRCSGGGTVLQGPGCLNYSLVLPLAVEPRLHSIVAANRWIMERNRAAVATLFPPNQRVPEIKVRGHTDLTIDGRKFSGNAQRRRKHCLLFHGTFLLQLDLDQITRFLPIPSRQPAYRENRSHAEFLANLGLPAAEVKRALQLAWDAFDPLRAVPGDRVATLVCERYSTREWNWKF